MSVTVIDAKQRQKRSIIATTVPAIGGTDDHTDGSWSDDDIYSGELFLNVPDERLWIGVGAAVKEIAFTADIPAMKNLETDDLVSTDNDRSFETNGTGAGSSFTVAALGGAKITRFLGDGDVNFYDNSAVIYSSFDQSSQKFSSAKEVVGLIGTAAQYARDTYSRLAASSGVERKFNSTGKLIFDFRQASGHGTLGIRENTGTTNTIFMHGQTGTIEVGDKYKVNGTNGLGAAGGTTYTFGGGGSGDIATMTFEGGLLTAVTTVP